MKQKMTCFACGARCGARTGESAPLAFGNKPADAVAPNDNCIMALRLSADESSSADESNSEDIRKLFEVVKHVNQIFPNRCALESVLSGRETMFRR